MVENLLRKGLSHKSSKAFFLRKIDFLFDSIFYPQVWHLRKCLRSFAGWKSSDLLALDAAAGNGLFSYWMNRKNPSWHITAILSDEGIVGSGNDFFTRSDQGKVEFEHSSMEHFIRPLIYDLVLCGDLDEESSKELAVFQNFYTSMKSEALLIISKLAGRTDSGSLAIWTEDSHKDKLRDKLLLVGFKKVDIHYQYGVAGRMAWKISHLVPNRMTDKSNLFKILLPFYFLISAPLCMVLNWLDSHIDNKEGSGLIVKAWK